MYVSVPRTCCKGLQVVLCFICWWKKGHVHIYCLVCSQLHSVSVKGLSWWTQGWDSLVFLCLLLPVPCFVSFFLFSWDLGGQSLVLTVKSMLHRTLIHHLTAVTGLGVCVWKVFPQDWGRCIWAWNLHYGSDCGKLDSWVGTVALGNSSSWQVSIKIYLIAR